MTPTPTAPLPSGETAETNGAHEETAKERAARLRAEATIARAAATKEAAEATRARATVSKQATAVRKAKLDAKTKRTEGRHLASDHFGRGDHVELAVSMLARVRERGAPVLHDEGALWRYDPRSGLYVAVGHEEQSNVVQSFAGSLIEGQAKPLALKASDVGGAIKLASHRVSKPGFFANAPRGLAFADGFVAVTEKGISRGKLSAENRARFGYAFAYVGNVVPKQFLGFLEALFRDDEDKVEKILFLQEFFGASLLGMAPVYQRCLVGLGSGENGKSKLGDLVLAAMPRGSTCAVPPQEFEQEYRRAMLVGKRLNFVSELPEAEILASESFKAIVDGSAITGRPIREAPVTFRPVAGHYFAANRLPPTNDQSHAFWRRFIVIPFNRSFESDPARDPRIAEKIIAAELPAIVAWLLEGGARVLRANEYTIPASHHAALRAWRRDADQISLFIEERTAPSQSPRPSTDRVHDWTSASVLYGEYREWAQRNGHRPVASNTFGTRMRFLGRGPLHTSRGGLYPVRVGRRASDGPLTNGNDCSSPVSPENSRGSDWSDEHDGL